MLALYLGYKIVYTGYFPSVMLIGVIPEQRGHSTSCLIDTFL